MGRRSDENVSRDMTEAERGWLEQFGHLLQYAGPVPAPRDDLPSA